MTFSFQSLTDEQRALLDQYRAGTVVQICAHQRGGPVMARAAIDEVIQLKKMLGEPPLFVEVLEGFAEIDDEK
jgi:hypothetical protein